MIRLVYFLVSFDFCRSDFIDGESFVYGLEPSSSHFFLLMIFSLYHSLHLSTHMRYANSRRSIWIVSSSFISWHAIGYLLSV